MSRYLFCIIGEPDHYDRWESSSESEQQAVLDHFSAFARAVREHGHLVAGESLERPSQGFSIGGERPDRRVVDGPYAGSAEHLAGFYVADLPDETTAREVAALLPPTYGIEVRFCPDVGVTPRDRP